MAKPAETAEVGTKESAFAKGDKWGPFDCGHCRHYVARNGNGVCVHPSVVADVAPELSRRDEQGKPFVQAIDCCRYQRKKADAPGSSEAKASGMRG